MAAANSPTSSAAAAAPAHFAAIDFGTSNSAIALPEGARAVRLVELEPGYLTMPTAVFYRADGSAALAEPERLYGRAAVAAYVEGVDGRLMRSMKSILGSPLVEQSTDVGGGRGVRYADIIAGYLRHLKRRAEAAAGAPLSQVVLGRPVFFVDGDPERDAQAQAALAAAAHQVGFRDVHFQYEPIAAALDHESGIDHEQLVLVADIGGGTSDFSLVRVGPARRGRVDRRDDILANHGVHIAGTDFDRHLELTAILPLLGYRSYGAPQGGLPGREVPSGVYFDLATWHLINTVYTPSRVAELRRMKSWYTDPAHHRRLMTVLEERLGHALAAAAEQAKIDVATTGAAEIDLDAVEPSLAAALGEARAAEAIEADLARIVAAAVDSVRMAGVPPQRLEVLYFTGGSTGLSALVDRIAAAFPGARRVRGDRFASVAQGLGLHARALYGAGQGR
jgi:hypothetical chaperone protein